MLIRLLLSLAVSLFVASAAFAQADKQVPEQVDEPALYDMLLGEIALQRGDYALAAKTYLELAKQTRDPRVAQPRWPPCRGCRRAGDSAAGSRAPC